MAGSRVTPKQLQALRERAKQQLQRDMNVEKAAELMAQEQLILMDESIPPALKTAQLKQLNPQVRHWTQKARQPFATITLDESDIDVGPTQSMVSALVKSIQDIKQEPIEEIETPILPKPKKKRKKADDLTPKPTPTPRRAKKRRLPETPLTGIEALDPDTVERLQELRESPSSTPKQGIGKAVKRGVKKSLKKSGKELAKNWLDF